MDEDFTKDSKKLFSVWIPFQNANYALFRPFCLVSASIKLVYKVSHESK